MFDLHALIEKIKKENSRRSGRLDVFGQVSRLYINGQQVNFCVIEEMLDFISANRHLVKRIIIARINGISTISVNTKLK